MAKTKPIEEVDLNNNENPMEEKSGDAAKDRVAEEVTIVTGTKKVRIHTIEEVDCYIAGTHYELAKGKDFNVPSDVAAILCYGEKAYRV